MEMSSFPLGVLTVTTITGAPGATSFSMLTSSIAHLPAKMKAGHKCPLLYFTLLSVTMWCHGKDGFFNDDGNLVLPGSYDVPWMAGIENFRTLSLITLPGSHESMALHGGPEVECQSWHLKDQLRAGIRFLDLKVFGLGDTLYVMHGVFYQQITLKDVLDTVRAFLSEFKTEAVLIRIQPESFEKNTVNQMVQSLIGNDPNVWLKSDMPNMGQIRGKIVLIQKSTFTLGIPFIETNGESVKEVSNVKAKDNRIIKQLNQANEAYGGDNAVLTYTSGSGLGTFFGMFLTPKRVAERVNPWLNQYIRQFYANKPRPCFGIIAMDFPGIDLIQTVINLNWW